MKITQKIGMLLFVIGFALFTVNIFMGSYKMDPNVTKEYFTADENNSAGKKDTISKGFTSSLNKLFFADKEYSNQFAFFADLESAILDYNATITNQLLLVKGITPDETERLYDAINFDEGINYSEQVLTSVLGEGSFKVKLLADNTSWMYSDVKTDYIDFEAFKKDFEVKLNEINGKAGSEYHIHNDKGTWLALSKNLNTSPAKTSTGLWFFLTFGLIIIGTLAYNLPNIKLLGPAGIKNDGIYQSGLTNRGLIAWVILIYLVTFYILMYFAPHWLNNSILLVEPLSRSLSGGAASEWFLYGFIYCVAMTLMAVRMYIKYRQDTYQIVRTTVVLFFQIGFAFLIPEILVRFNMPYYDFKMIWPLDYDFLFDWNIKSLLGAGKMGTFMLVWGLALTTIIVPIMVYLYGKRWYCSWVCGCGGLAETLGDPYRQNSSKTMNAWKFERYIIHAVLIFAILMTIATGYTYFHNSADGYFLTTSHFLIVVMIGAVGMISLMLLGKGSLLSIDAKHKKLIIGIGFGILAVSIIAIFTGTANILFMDSYTIRWYYGLMIGSIFSGVIGTGFYPIFGNRTWCRFGCPLAAYLGLIQRFKSKFRITTNGGQCISCGNCSTYCEQGIDVRAYAQRGEDIIRASCVGCGVCSAVCPRGVLKLENSDAPKKIDDNPLIFENNIVKLNLTVIEE
ncbi:MAG: ferredoxin-type protein NapH [Flavobacteriaceae bacterium]|jgi:ferredoxin-type protein NapH